MENADCSYRNEDEHIGRYINHLSKTLRYTTNAMMMKQGEIITGEQCRIISYIAHRPAHGECVYQRDLEDDFGVKRSSVASILGNLEKSGYIARSVCEEDARIKRITLTEKGLRTSKQMYDNICRLEQYLSNGMTPHEREEFIRLMKLAIENLEKFKEE